MVGISGDNKGCDCIYSTSIISAVTLGQLKVNKENFNWKQGELLFPVNIQLLVLTGLNSSGSKDHFFRLRRRIKVLGSRDQI